jgi:hypothetical protein
MYKMLSINILTTQIDMIKCVDFSGLKLMLIQSSSRTYRLKVMIPASGRKIAMASKQEKVRLER